MNTLKDALEVYNSGAPLSNKDLETLVNHFRALNECVEVNPELHAIRLYTYSNLNRLEDYVAARKEKKPFKEQIINSYSNTVDCSSSSSDSLLDNITCIRDELVKNRNKTVLAVYCLFSPEVKAEILSSLLPTLQESLYSMPRAQFSYKGVNYVESDQIAAGTIHIQTVNTPEDMRELSNGILQLIRGTDKGRFGVLFYAHKLWTDPCIGDTTSRSYPIKGVMILQIKKRSQALLDGDKYYFTGKPCKNGHVCKRHISSGCYECTLSYQKSYRENNSDYWSKKNVKWNNANREYKRSSDKLYREKTKERRKAFRSIYKSQKKQASKIFNTEWDLLVMEECYDLVERRGNETGLEWHIDHMYPLKARNICGLHCGDNLQVIPAQMNLEKNNKLWYTERYQFTK